MLVAFMHRFYGFQSAFRARLPGEPASLNQPVAPQLLPELFIGKRLMKLRGHAG
jgi:hypothetical protein